MSYALHLDRQSRPWLGDFQMAASCRLRITRLRHWLVQRNRESSVFLILPPETERCRVGGPRELMIARLGFVHIYIVHNIIDHVLYSTPCALDLPMLRP
jgi:hypothetical protein